MCYNVIENCRKGNYKHMITIKIKNSKLNKYDKTSAFVSFPYDSQIVDFIKKFPMRFYHADTKEWEIPIEKIETIKRRYGCNVKIDTENEKPQKESNLSINVNSFKTKPFLHQIDGIKYGMTKNNWILGDEQGLGKTKTVIDIAILKKKQNNYKHVLIICCVNGLKYNWANEISTHSYESAYILGQRLQKNGKLCIKGNKEKLEDIQNLPDNYFIITNIETLRNAEIVSAIKNLCDNKQINMIAVDEMHKCANPTSQQSKGLLQLHAEINIAMTGTPLLNNPLDLFVPLNWLGYENHKFYSFRQHYCLFGGFGGYQITGYKNMDELQEKLNKVMLRRRKKDVLDLPPKTYIDEYVEMGNNQNKIYTDVLNTIRENIDKIRLSVDPLSQLIRLRQATGYTGILSTEIKESAKLDRLVELVQDTISNGQKVIIFSNWVQMVEVIKTELNPICKGLSITGETNTIDRQVNVNHFQNNVDYKYIVGTIGAMGTGLTLTAGTVVIFVDEPWTKAAYDQAVDRAHRIGTTANILVYNLITKNTIDERIHEILKRKGDMADLLIDGKIKYNDKNIIDYLIS